jgi:hypothetical protein
VVSTHSELIIDCGQFYEGCAAPMMHTRIITGRAYASRLLEGLEQALVQHDARTEK